MKTVRLKTQRVTVKAPRALCFEVVAAAGTVVEQRSEVERVVEFELEHKGKPITTRELLTLHFHETIDYRWLEGPLPLVEERISFEARADKITDMVYEGRFALGPGWRKWLIARFVIKRTFDRLALEHLEEGKSVAENRATRSRLYG